MWAPTALLFLTLAVFLHSIESSSQGRGGRRILERGYESDTSEVRRRRERGKEREISEQRTTGQDSGRRDLNTVSDPPKLQDIPGLEIPSGLEIRFEGRIITKYERNTVSPYILHFKIAVFREPPPGHLTYTIEILLETEWEDLIARWAKAVARASAQASSPVQGLRLNKAWILSVRQSAAGAVAELVLRRDAFLVESRRHRKRISSSSQRINHKNGNEQEHYLNQNGHQSQGREVYADANQRHQYLYPSGYEEPTSGIYGNGNELEYNSYHEHAHQNQGSEFNDGGNEEYYKLAQRINQLAIQPGGRREEPEGSSSFSSQDHASTPRVTMNSEDFMKFKNKFGRNR